MILPEPTKRAMIDVGRKCNMNCNFCYYKHLGDLRLESFTPSIDLECEINSAHKRGCNYIDFTGGEPTIYPEITRLIKHALSKDIKSCVITNAICGDKTVQKILDSGVDDFLISLHGHSEEMHDKLTNKEGARRRQERFMNYLKGNFKNQFRFNAVIAKYNQNYLPELARYMVKWNPKIVNFINMNPHGDWSKDRQGTREVIADLRVAEVGLNEAINILEDHGIGVNVRYYPMCRINKYYRRTVCNDLHVMFDPYEWDYKEMPKTYEQYKSWGVRTSKNIEYQGMPCCDCDIKHICGGINTALTLATSNKMIDKQSELEMKDCSFYHYRANNKLTLRSRDG